MVMVSDHGMNNVPGCLAKDSAFRTYSAARKAAPIMSSPTGTSLRLQAFGPDPLVSRVPTESTASFYLKGQAAAIRRHGWMWTGTNEPLYGFATAT